jgi:folate-dependent phosphoribosylglycinamide formyltransferase PurN
MLKIGWFSTARGEGSRQLFITANQHIENGDIKGKIDFVFCSREPKESDETDNFFKLVQSYNIPLFYYSFQKFKSDFLKDHNGLSQDASIVRIEYDREVMRLLAGLNPDICMLAGYMLIVGNEMCRKYNMINLHPALPGGPTGTWKEVIWKLIDSRAEESGVMIHLATPDLDRGPVISFCRYPIIGGDFNKLWQEIEGLTAQAVQENQGEDNELFLLIRQHGMSRELPLIVLTLKALGDGDTRIENGRVFDKDRNQISGYDLSDKVDRMIGR